MTTERQVGAVGLEEVRARFLDAEQALSDANRAITTIQGASAQIGGASQSVTDAATKLGGLASSLGDLTATLAENAVGLREGVDAIRLGDPAEVRRMLSELDAAFTAYQSTVVQRLDSAEARQGELTQQFEAIARTSRRQVFEARLGFALLAIGIVAAIIVAFLR